MSWNLDAAVGALTRPTKHRVLDPVTGEAKWITADPLLLQLVLAIANSGGSTAFKSSNGNPIPISAGALDIYQQIEKETAERWWALHHLHHGQGRSTLAGRLRAWAMAVRADKELLKDAERLVCGWVDGITSLLQPVRRIEIIGACPECDAAKVERYDDEGGVILAPALALVHEQDGSVYATCTACGEKWVGHDLVVLARAVNGDVPWLRK